MLTSIVDVDKAILYQHISLYILCAKILATRIRNNRLIKGIHLKGKEVKITQFADDTTLILGGSEQSLYAAMKEIIDFGNLSGLKLNFSKTNNMDWFLIGQIIRYKYS